MVSTIRDLWQEDSCRGSNSGRLHFRGTLRRIRNSKCKTNTWWDEANYLPWRPSQKASKITMHVTNQMF